MAGDRLYFLLDTLEEALEEFSIKIKSSPERKIIFIFNELQGKLDRQSSEINLLLDLYNQSDTESRYNALWNNYQDLKKHYDILYSEYIKTKPGYTAPDRDYNNKLKSLQDEKDRLRETATAIINKQKEDIQRLGHESDEQKVKIQRLEIENNVQKGIIERLENQNKDLGEKLRQKESSLIDKEASIATLESALAKKDQEIARLKDELAKLKAQPDTATDTNKQPNKNQDPVPRDHTPSLPGQPHKELEPPVSPAAPVSPTYVKPRPKEAGWIAPFLLTKKTVFPRYPAAILATIKNVKNLDAMKDIAAKSTFERAPAIARQLGKLQTQLEQLVNDLQQKLGSGEEDLLEYMATTYFDILKRAFLDNIVVSIYRGNKEGVAFYKELLPAAREWMKKTGLYTRPVCPGAEMTDEDYEDMKPYPKPTPDKALKNVIYEVDRLPYYLSWQDEEGRESTRLYPGILTVYTHQEN